MTGLAVAPPKPGRRWPRNARPMDVPPERNGPRDRRHPALAGHRRPGLPVLWNEIHAPRLIVQVVVGCGGAAMRTSLRRIAIAATAVAAVVAATAALPGGAEARWHGGGGHGGWHRHGGWGWGGFGWGFAPGFAIGVGAPFYGGYYGGPYSAYGGDCVMRRGWVIDRWGHRVLRWTRVCY